MVPFCFINIECFVYFTAADVKSLGTAYFILKSFNPEDISISQTKGIWATQPHNEVVLNKAFEVCTILHTDENHNFQVFREPVLWVICMFITFNVYYSRIFILSEIRGSGPIF